MKNVLVIAAHPDDEVLGCGGTIARLALQGAKVEVLIVANGLTSRIDFDGGKADGLLKKHHERAMSAGKLLGVKEVRFLKFPDQKLDTLPLLDITQKIEKVIDEVEPDTIFAQHGGDLNMDHAITYRAVLTATRPMKGHPVKRVYSYEVASSTEWAFNKFHPQFNPGFFVDISETVQKKIDAIAIYESECRPFPHPRSAEALRASAQRWGSVVGVTAAEAFEVIREIW